MSFTTLGHRVGLGGTAAAARVRRMEETGVIAGYRTVLGSDVAEDGLEAFVDVQLVPERDSAQFGTWARRLPGVVEALHVTGPDDYVLRVRLSDTGALDSLLRRLRREGGVARTQTRLILRPEP